MDELQKPFDLREWNPALKEDGPQAQAAYEQINRQINRTRNLTLSALIQLPYAELAARIRTNLSPADSGLCEALARLEDSSWASRSCLELLAADIETQEAVNALLRDLSEAGVSLPPPGGRYRREAVEAVLKNAGDWTYEMIHTRARIDSPPAAVAAIHEAMRAGIVAPTPPNYKCCKDNRCFPTANPDYCVEDANGRCAAGSIACQDA